jgi:hypothetical protein
MIAAPRRTGTRRRGGHAVPRRTITRRRGRQARGAAADKHAASRRMPVDAPTRPARRARPVPRRIARRRRGKRLQTGQDGKVDVVVAGKFGHGPSGQVVCTGQSVLGDHRASDRRSTSEIERPFGAQPAKLSVRRSLSVGVKSPVTRTVSMSQPPTFVSPDTPGSGPLSNLVE